MANPAPLDETITLAELASDPYPIYRRLRREAPVLRVKSAGRTLLTKAADTKYVKDNPGLFSSDDPNTPMKRAFWAHTLMRKDGEAHKRERMAMAPAFAPRVIQNDWMPQYQRIAEDYVGRLPRGEVVDLFAILSGAYAARGLAILLGMEEATDEEMMEWSQALIEGAGNFGWADAPFERADRANEAIHALLDRIQTGTGRSRTFGLFRDDQRRGSDPGETDLRQYQDCDGGGINEPRDALNTIIYGLLTNPDQLANVKANGDWDKAFEEGVRWVAPIQASSRLVTEDTEIRGHIIPKGDTVMTIQASACRDEELFEDGESFNVYRTDAGQHQAFGNGPHSARAPMSRAAGVGKVMLPILFDRFPNMSLPDPDAVIFRGFGFRGPVQIPVLLN